MGWHVKIQAEILDGKLSGSTIVGYIEIPDCKGTLQGYPSGVVAEDSLDTIPQRPENNIRFRSLVRFPADKKVIAFKNNITGQCLSWIPHRCLIQSDDEKLT
jgi:hypothetical protein